MKKKPAPTDFELLDAIYERYYDTFSAFSEGAGKGRDTKIYVPIDCEAIGEHLGVDPDIVFGRLYYDLQHRFGYTQANKAEVPFFYMQIGQDRHCVHFPRLSAVLAGLRDEQRERSSAKRLAAVSLIVSIVAILISVLKP